MENRTTELELQSSQLRAPCDPALLTTDTTRRSALLGEVGQARALEAIDFGLEMNQRGYNLFVVGAAGSGRSAAVHARIQQLAKQRPVPPDLCYVQNFQDPRRPRLLELPAGQGQRLRNLMTKLVDQLEPALTTRLESAEFREREQTLQRATSEQVRRELEPLRLYARAHDIAIVAHDQGFTLAPMKNGQVLDTEQAGAALSEDERTRLDAAADDVQARLREVLPRLPPIQRAHIERTRELARAATADVVHELSVDLRRGFAGVTCVEQYLDEVEGDIVEHAAEIIRVSEEHGAARWFAGSAQDADRRLSRYRVNVLVDHTSSQHAPVVELDHATVTSLLGRIEHYSQLGVLMTDFSLIKPGALHRANGGYLLVDAYQLLSQPFAWEQLKRTLRCGEIRLEPLFDAWNVWSSVSQEPAPVPLDLKLVLIGEPQLYRLLADNDPQFPELFKIVADYEDNMRRDDAACLAYSQMLAQALGSDTERAASPACLARLIEESSRCAGDARRLDLRLRPYLDLLREADQHAQRARHEQIELEDLERALQAREQRHGRIRDAMREQIRDGLLRVETSGARVGQVNALSVIPIGEGTFGIPSRVSARVRLGRGEVVDIEREVRMAGPSHSKSVLILGAFLGGQYLVDRALSLRASLVFEQMYGFIDGDSASLAELLALLSAIAEVPVPQHIGITGSIDQHGFVQAVGGLHEKIEGFFETCRDRNLTGTQGVMIPRICAPQLMLKDEVVDAVRGGQFHIYAVDHVDEAIRVLLGEPPGERTGDGRYPACSFHRRVEDRLERFAAAAQKTAAAGEV